MQGLNITITVKRSTLTGTDSVGGVERSLTTVYTGVKSRIAAMKPSEEVIMQGFEVEKYYNCAIWPASVDIKESDIIIPDSGPHAGVSFRVLGVQFPSLPYTDKRAFKSLRLEHVDYARSVQ